MRSALVDAEVRVRSGELVRVRRGAYVAATDLGAEPYRRAGRLALARTLAVVAQSPSPLVVTHESAADLWGLPLVDVPDRVHVTQATRPRPQKGADVYRHSSRLTPDEVCTIAGLRVTTLARTAADCLRTLSGPAALAVADAALRAGLAPEEMDEALRRAGAGRGVRRARAVWEFADDGAESPGESYARAILLSLGLPRPETQVRVDTVDGPFWADLGWQEWRLLAEYDGRAKYGTASADPRALLREKRREDVIRDEAWRMLRLTSDDTAGPRALLTRVARLAPRGAVVALTPRPYLARRPGRATELGGPA